LNQPTITEPSEFRQSVSPFQSQPQIAGAARPEMMSNLSIHLHERTTTAISKTLNYQKLKIIEIYSLFHSVWNLQWLMAALMSFVLLWRHKVECATCHSFADRKTPHPNFS
jgi:hypothetical protein